MNSDSDYVFASIYFYRLEHALALSLIANIPHVFFSDSMPPHLLEDLGSRVLKQNILERLPSPEQYGKFDLSEIAAFIRTNTPIIESHVPVSFYLDETAQIIDKPKIKLARMLMRQFYSFGEGVPTQ